MITKNILIEARNLISDEARWTTGASVDENGAHCLGGAISKVAFGDAEAFYSYDADIFFYDFIELAGLSLHKTDMYGEYDFISPTEAVWDFNDGSNHADVLDLLDKAIANAPEGVTFDQD